ncbi:MAG: DUF308 domain-containing protein [Rikenellaceae bacterium]|nr:DUF308 domain-containing protein [Rikenellaceae bacterium]
MLKIFSSDIWRSIISLLVGIVMVVWSHLAINYAIVITGILILLSGLISMIMFTRNTDPTREGLPVQGMLGLILGVFLIVAPSFFVSIIMILLGAVIIVASLNQLSGLALARRNGFRIPGFLYLFPVLLLIAGFVIFFDPFASAQGLVVFFGCAVIFYGLTDLVNYFIVRNSR